MDGVDRVLPLVGPIGFVQPPKQVERSDPDGGRHKDPEEETPRPHDILEIHDEEAEIPSPDLDQEESSGLDLAV